MPNDLRINGRSADLVELYRLAAACYRAPWTCPSCDAANRGKDLRCHCGTTRPEETQ